MTDRRRRSLLLVLLVSLSGVCAQAQRADAEDGMEWQFSETSDPNGEGRMTARLIYGVPETDNIQVLGICSASQSAPSASLIFGADIGTLETGKDTDLRFSGGGFDYALKGQISRPAGEEGVSGVRADIAADDSLWGAFAEKESLDYLVPGYKASTIDLTRGKDKIASFLQACKSLAAAPPSQPASGGTSGSTADKDDFESAKELGTAEAWQAFLANHPSGFYADLARAYLAKLSTGVTPQAAVTSVPDVPDPSCAEVSNLRTTNSDVPTKLTIVNKSGVDRILRWIDERGRIEDYGTIKAGRQATVDTFLENPWLITDEDGKTCFQVIMPHAGGRVVEFTGGSPTGLWTPRPEQPAAKEVTPKKNVTANKSSGCGKGKISIEGRCIRKSDAAGFCGPGYHLQGHKCAQGYVAPTHPKSVHGCPPGQAWSAEEGCHEDD